MAQRERGVVSGANSLARSVGSAVGVAIYGAVANSVIAAAGAAGYRDIFRKTLLPITEMEKLMGKDDFVPAADLAAKAA